MAEHYTRNVMEVSAWCKKCWANTMHRVDGGRKGPCLKCMAKLEQTPRPVLAAKQERLF